MEPDGASEDYLVAKANQINIGDACLADHAALGMPEDLRKLAGASWAEMPESVACDTPIYGYLCSFLSERYIISVGAYKGKMLSVKSALGCLGGLIVQAEAKWSGKCSPEYQVSATPARQCCTPLARSTPPPKARVPLCAPRRSPSRPAP